MNRRDWIRAAGCSATAVVLKAGAPVLGAGKQSRDQSRPEIQLSPASWSLKDREKYIALESEFGGPHPAAIGSKGMVAGTSNPIAIHSGLLALQHGGTAADAALCTALTQVSLMFGAATSYAGAMNALYYEGSTRKVFSIDACYKTVKDEKNPMTIPPFGTPSGRSVLVPGFMAGVQAIHNRFGKLPFSALFGPAIWVAETGVPANMFLTKPLGSQKKFVTRLPEGKRIFTKPDGGAYQDGDLFRQPILAPTLRAVAREGADYMYRGEWAKQLVDAVQDEGGKLTLEDLADYKVEWADPLEVTYRGYRIASLAAPNLGGAITLIAMNLLAAAGLTKLGHYANSAETMYWSIHISRLATILANRSPDSLRGYFPDVDLSPASLLKPQTANKIWQRMQQPDWNQAMDRLRSGKPAKNHSAAVLTIDAEGNMASIVHSINSIGWGCCGIFVGGVSIPDSACIQQGTVAKVGSGKPLPGPANPIIVLRNGQPVLASAAIGSGLHPVTMQNLHNVLDFDMEPKKAADTPNFMGPYYGIQLTGPAKPEMEKETIGEGDFSDAMIEKVQSLGQKIKRVPKSLNRPQLGYWIGIRINRDSGKITGGVTPELNAHVEGY